MLHWSLSLMARRNHWAVLGLNGILTCLSILRFRFEVPVAVGQSSSALLGFTDWPD